MSKNNTANYYEQDFQTSIEKAILAEDLYFTTIDNIQGKFYLPVMMPTSDIDKPVISLIVLKSMSYKLNELYDKFAGRNYLGGIKKWMHLNL